MAHIGNRERVSSARLSDGKVSCVALADRQVWRSVYIDGCGAGKARRMRICNGDRLVAERLQGKREYVRARIGRTGKCNQPAKWPADPNW